MLDDGIDLSDWAQCFRTNSSFLDCPISEYEDSEANYTMYVMVHQASPIEASTVSLSVPHGHYTVFVFNTSTGGYEYRAEPSVLCSNDHYVNDEGVETNLTNCKMHVDVCPWPGDGTCPGTYPNDNKPST